MEDPAVHAQRIHRMFKLSLCIDEYTDDVTDAVIDDSDVPPIEEDEDDDGSNVFYGDDQATPKTSGSG